MITGRLMLAIKEKENKNMEKLLNKIPMKYRECVFSIEREYGLTDDLKYMIYLKDGYFFTGGELSIPVSSIKEAIRFLKDVEKK
jgi:hypothetical protein